MPQHPQQFAPYQPQGYMTAGSSPLLSQQPIHGFVYVTGIDGAKAYQMPPNSEMPLFDDSGDVLYIKTTDGAGFPTITVVDCTKRDSQPVSQQDVPTMADVEAVHNEIEQLRREIHELVSATAADGPEQRHLRATE
jgi:hypothetical protein